MGAANDLHLFGEAAHGSIAAHVSLMKMSRQGADTGALAAEEGLALAELFGRFALSLGQRDALVPLVSALLARCAFEHEHGRPERGCHAGAQVLRRLNLAADDGDEDAAAAIPIISAQLPIDAVALAAEWQSAEQSAEHDGYDELFRKAGAGDVDALWSISQTILSETMNGSVSQLEGLTLLESVARLGAVHDDAACKQALAGVLLIRADMSRKAGVPDCGRYSEVLALSLLSELAEGAHPKAAEYLEAAVAEVHPHAVVEATKRRPVMLIALQPQGEC